jgi:copper chaperone CopZ
MRCLFLSTAMLFLAAAATGQEVKPHPVTVTFYVAGVKSSGDAEAITASLKKVPSFTKVEGLTPTSGFANVSFDSHVSSYHQIAQAIADASSGDKKYEATIRVLVPEYAQGENAGKVDAIFKKLAERIKVETTDKEKGLFVVHFLPLKLEPEKKGPQGFNGGQIGHPIHDEAPKGLGLKFSIAKEKVVADK